MDIHSREGGLVPALGELICDRSTLRDRNASHSREGGLVPALGD